MFDNLLQKTAFGIVSVATVVAGWFGIASKKDIPILLPPVIEYHTTQIPVEKPVGTTIPTVISLFETSLQSSISSSASSMTLVSGTDRGGNALSGYMCFTIDEGSSVAEFVCGTASGTSVTSLTRGISPLTGTSTVASLQFVHRRGASVKITNYPQLAIVSRILNGSETLPNQLVYDSSVSSSTMASNLQNVASVAYVNSVAIAGAPNASTAAKGLVQAATGAQISVSTAAGSTGALLFAPSTLYSSTSSATILVPVTKANGKLAQGFLDLTENFTWTGLHTFSATTTLASTTINGALTVSATSTFSIPPLLTASTTQTTQATSKQYVDNRFSYGNSTTTAINSSWSSVTSTTIASITVTPPVAGRLLITAALSASNNGTAQDCITALYIDKTFVATTSAITSSSGAKGTLGFSYVTTQQTAAPHTIDLTGSVTSNACTLYSGPNFSALNIGN